MLLLAGVLAVAAILVNLRPREPRTPVSYVRVAVARQGIEPYSIISSSQVTLGAELIPDTLAPDYYLDEQQVAGLMSTRAIKAGQLITRQDARPVEEIRYVEDMALEVVSFPALFSEMVAGQVKPGHRINIYGYRTEAGRDSPGEAVLVASSVWVVDVRTASGDEVQTPEQGGQDETGGLFGAPLAASVYQPASVVSVAAPPAVVRDIIYAFGAKDFQAWVTLAPSAENIPPTAVWATPTPAAPETPSPTPEAGATPTPVTPVTPTSLSGAVYMSDRDGGPKMDSFPNNTSVVWAVVNLQYSPDGPIAIRLDVRDADGALYFEGEFAHPQSGQQSYLIVPMSGFSPDTAYTTQLYAGDKTFSADWRLHGNSVLPPTGGDDSSHEDNGSGTA